MPASTPCTSYYRGIIDGNISECQGEMYGANGWCGVEVPPNLGSRVCTPPPMRRGARAQCLAAASSASAAGGDHK